MTRVISNMDPDGVQNLANFAQSIQKLSLPYLLKSKYYGFCLSIHQDTTVLSPKGMPKMDLTPSRTPVARPEPPCENFPVIGSIEENEDASALASCLITYLKRRPSKHEYWIQPCSHRQDLYNNAGLLST